MNILENNRYRVVGHNGPDRNLLPCFKKLGTMSSDFLSEATNFIKEIGNDYDDLNVLKTEKIVNNGKLVTNCQLATGNGADTFCVDKMRSIFIQQSNKEEALDEIDYQTPIPGSEKLIEHVKYWITPNHEFFRSRINILDHGTHIPPHIDTNTSVYVRIMFILEGNQKFFVKRRNRVYEQLMVSGEIYFINQGWTHWIENLTKKNEHRSSLLVSCKWPAIEKYFEYDQLSKFFL